MRTETILFIVNEERREILLGMKKVRFGAGKYNGMGGGVEEGESVEKAAVREVHEEVGLVVAESDLEKRATIRFSFEGKPEWSRVAHVFVARRWDGDPKESDEMAPEWFTLDSLPFERMWVDDPLWLPQVLAGGKLEASFHFTGDGSRILRESIKNI